MAKPLTTQQREPHAELVKVRDRVRECGYGRKQAASICDQLSHSQCDLVLKAKDDKAVVAAIKTVELPADVEGETKEVPQPNRDEANRFKREQRDVAKAIKKQYGEEEEEVVAAK